MIFSLMMFDFGGVVAEEGFREGLKAIGARNGLDPDRFYSLAETLIHETGYVVGKCGETDYWRTVRDRTGITGTDRELRTEILSRFVLRPQVLSCIDRMRSREFPVVMLSDQTNWLDEINKQTGLFRHFDRVFNSYHIGKSKRELSLFPEVCRQMGVAPRETLFVDDNHGHIERAARAGMTTIQYTTFEDCEQRLQALTGR